MFKMVITRTRTSLRRWMAPVAVAASALMVSSCFYGVDSSISFTEMYNRGKPGSGAEQEGMLPWVCQGSGLAGGHGGHDDMVANPAYLGMTKGNLSWDDCAGVVDFMDKAWASVGRYPTRGSALDAGARQSVQFVPGLGTHDMLPGVSATGLDPARPLFLQYDGMGRDAKLAGMSWFVINGDDVHPPAGLPGNNDWWHTHNTLCFSGAGTVVGNEITAEECAARGGTLRVLPGVWMLHAWIVPGYENPKDVFSSGFMCVKGTGPVAPDDPCHGDTTDPEPSNPTTTVVAPPPPTTTTTVGTPPSTDAHGHTNDDHSNMTTTTVKPVTTMPPMDHGA